MLTIEHGIDNPHKNPPGYRRNPFHEAMKQQITYSYVCSFSVAFSSCE
jgi:hypothetical protein